MAIRFLPNGNLDVATASTLLPDELVGKTVVSGAMTRCTNLSLDRMAIAKTRSGSDILNDVALDQTALSRIIEQAGTRYSFSGTKIYKDEVEIDSGYTSTTWSAILYNPYNAVTQSVFALNGSERVRIEGDNVYLMGIAAPIQQPLVNIGVLTGLTGDYNVKYTYARIIDDVVVCESNPSPAASSAINLANESLNIDWTASGDSQVTHVRIYRTLRDGTRYYHDQDVVIGTTTVDSITTDSALGTEIAVNYDEAPLGTTIIGPNFNGYCFILKDNLLHYCLPKQPEYWPETYYLEISPIQFPLKGGTFLDGTLFVATISEIYSIQGSGADSFMPLPMSAQTGTVNADCFVAVKGYGIFHLGYDGIYQYTGGKDNLITRGTLEPVFLGDTAGSIPGLNRTYIDNCMMQIFKDKLYFAYPGGTDQYCGDMLVLSLSTNRVVHYSFPVQFRAMAIDYYNKRLLTGDTTGYIWHIENASQTTDNDTTIDWQIQSKDFNQFRKYFPRYASYDVTGTATGIILLDDVSQQTHTISGTRQTKKRLVDGCTGDRLAVRVSGSGSVIIYGIEIE